MKEEEINSLIAANAAAEPKVTYRIDMFGIAKEITGMKKDPPSWERKHWINFAVEVSKPEISIMVDHIRHEMKSWGHFYFRGQQLVVEEIRVIREEVISHNRL